MKSKQLTISPVLAALMLSLPALAIEPPSEATPEAPRQKQAQDNVRKANPEDVIPPVEEQKAPVAPAAAPERCYLGVILEPVPELLASHLKLADGVGLVIKYLSPDSPAAAAGISENDILLSLDGKKVRSVEEVRAITEARQAGDKVTANVIHNGEHKDIEVTLAAMPEHADVADNDAPGGEQLLGKVQDLFKQLGAEGGLRDALEKQLGQMKDMGNIPGEFMRRLREQMGGHGNLQQFHQGAASSFQSTIRLMDEEGSVELKTSDKGKEARVFDKAGKLLWEGPYETEQDKAVVPDDIQQRLEKLDLDTKFDLLPGGARMQIHPGQFRPLDQLDGDDAAPGKAADAPKGE